MNDTKTIIKYLKLYNEWRRGDEKMGQPNPIEIGKLIDEACEKLVSLERERDEWAALVGQYKSERDEARARVEIITPSKNNSVAEFFSSPNTPETEAATPETDDQHYIMAINDDGYQVPCVDIEFARKLEKERNEAREGRDAALLVIKGLKE